MEAQSKEDLKQALLWNLTIGGESAEKTLENAKEWAQQFVHLPGNSEARQWQLILSVLEGGEHEKALEEMNASYQRFFHNNDQKYIVFCDGSVMRANGATL